MCQSKWLPSTAQIMDTNDEWFKSSRIRQSIFQNRIYQCLATEGFAKKLMAE